MKVYIMTMLFVFGLEVGMKAQTDEFFMCRNEFRYTENNGGYESLLLPRQHGLDCNYYADAAPLESGCLLLLGMGLVYAKFKKQS